MSIRVRLWIAGVAGALSLNACATAQPATDASARTAEGTSKEQRGEVFVAALSGSADDFEAMVQRSYTPEAIARRTPAARRSLWEQINSDFGTMSIEEIQAQGASVILNVAGQSGRRARITLEFDGSSENRIAGANIELVEQGHEGGRIIPPPPISATMTTEELRAALGPWLDRVAPQVDLAGVVLVARRGEPVFSSVIRADAPERGDADSLDARFNVASIGKILTRVSVGQLIQAGRLSPDDTVGELLPDYPSPTTRSATVAQLLEHSGGVADFFGPEFEAADKSRFSSNRAFYEFVSQLPPRFAPGARTEYCNGCYVVLGEIVSRISGQSFEDYIARAVFVPAGMTRSGYHNRSRLPAGTTLPYTREGAPNRSENSSMFPASGSAAGGVYATAADLLAFENALRTNRLLNAEMTAWVLETPVARDRNNGPIGIAGGTPGANALLESDGEWTVIVLANRDPPAAVGTGTAIMRALSRR